MKESPIEGNSASSGTTTPAGPLGSDGDPAYFFLKSVQACQLEEALGKLPCRQGSQLSFNLLEQGAAVRENLEGQRSADPEAFPNGFGFHRQGKGLASNVNGSGNLRDRSGGFPQLEGLPMPEKPPFLFSNKASGACQCPSPGDGAAGCPIATKD